MKNLLAVIALIAVMTVIVSTPAAAQAPPMNMSWGIASQMRYQAQGDAFARAMAQNYYNYMQQLRARGYTGPSLPTGFNAQTLMQANQAANAAASRYIQGGMTNSNIRSNATGDWDMRALRGCQLAGTRYGERIYGCP